MGTCDTCKHWREVAATSTIYRGRYARPCGNPKLLGNGVDIDIDQLGSIGAPFETAREPGGVFIDTGPKFGCIHHAAKGPVPSV